MLKRVFTKPIRLETQNRLLKRYHLGGDAIDFIDDIEVCSYYDSGLKTRFFYSLSEDLELIYYSQLILSDSGEFFGNKLDIYYQSLVWTDPSLKARHRGFARSVIYTVYPKYIDTFLMLDQHQSDNGFYMWQNIIYEAINYGFSTFAYFYDKKKKLRCLCKLTQDGIRRYSDEFVIIFSDVHVYEDRGFIITKKDIDRCMINTETVECVPILDFVKAAEFL